MRQAIVGLEKLYHPGNTFQSLEVTTALQKNGVYYWSAVNMFGVVQFDANGKAVQRGTAMVKVFSRGRPKQHRWTEVMQPTFYYHDKVQAHKNKLEDKEFPLFIVWHKKPDKLLYTRLMPLVGQQSHGPLLRLSSTASGTSRALSRGR